MKKKILISTGGTGGHVIPASVFYDHLKNDFDVFLSSDERGVKFLNIDKEHIKIINTPKLQNKILLLPFNILSIIFLIFKYIFFFKKKKY